MAHQSLKSGNVQNARATFIFEKLSIPFGYKLCDGQSKASYEDTEPLFHFWSLSTIPSVKTPSIVRFECLEDQGSILGIQSRHQTSVILYQQWRDVTIRSLDFFPHICSNCFI